LDITRLLIRIVSRSKYIQRSFINIAHKIKKTIVFKKKLQKKWKRGKTTDKEPKIPGIKGSRNQKFLEPAEDAVKRASDPKSPGCSKHRDCSRRTGRILDFQGKTGTTDAERRVYSGEFEAGRQIRRFFTVLSEIFQNNFNYL
jgi:hypothetical protein